MFNKKISTLAVLFSTFAAFAFMQSSHSEEKPVGKVVRIQGTVLAHKIGNPKSSRQLSLNSKIYLNETIRARANSNALIALNNKLLKYIPAHSELKILKKSNHPALHSEINKMSTLLGTKANQAKEPWMDEAALLAENIKENFESGKFYEAVQSFEANPAKKSLKRESIYFLATSYLKLGNGDKSAELFQKLLHLKIYEYRNPATLGLFLSFLSSSQIEKAVKLYQNYAKKQANNALSLKMKEILRNYKK